MPFALWPAQVELLRSLQADPRILILKARQLGISWLVCAYSLWLCLFKPGQLVLIFSKGQDEANEMLRRINVIYTRLPEWMRGGLPALVRGNTSELEWGNGSRAKSLPATKSAGRSFTASLVVIDEMAYLLWARDLYTALKPTIDGGGQLIALSSGNGTGNLFYKLCQRAIKGGSRFKFHFLPWWARPGRDAAWYAATEADAATSAMMAQEYPATPDDAFTAGTDDRFLPSMQLWDANRAEVRDFPEGWPVVLAADAGVSNDSFGLLGVSRVPVQVTNADGSKGWTSSPDRVVKRFAREWKPPKGGHLDFQGTPDNPGPELEIRRLCREWNVVQLAYDPYQLHDMGTRLTREGVCWARPFSQVGERLEADKLFLDLITQRRFEHDGDEGLRAHVDNANRKPDPQTRKLRIVKRDPALKIDLAVCASMASAECLRLGL